MKNPRLKHLFIYMNAAVIIFTSVLFGWWYFFDGVLNPPLIDMGNPMTLKTDKAYYKPGDSITVFNSFCKKRNVEALISAQLVDGQIIGMTTTSNNLPVGCYGVDKPYGMTMTTIPTIISPGKWHLQWTVTYKINPIKTVTYSRSTVSFDIQSPVLPIPLNKIMAQ